MTATALSIEHVDIAFPGPAGPVPVVAGVSLAVAAGRTLGLVGESGSGKSMTLRAMCGLVPAPGIVTGGTVELGGTRYASSRELGRVRGTEVTMIFQDPAASLNPVRTVGSQLAEVLRVKRRASRAEARASGVELLDRVGQPEPRRSFDAYPHQLSGGQRQRVMIAMAVAPRPKVILADEPTTALDVVTQEQILALLQELQREHGTAIVLVTHDLGVAAQVCHDVATLYAGCVVERGSADSVLRRPRHPYTRALIDAVPSLSTSTLPVPIEGGPPEHAPRGLGCSFAPRCGLARAGCEAVDMRLEQLTSCACPFERAR
jgi:oligopeptide/dipeptide ABC transporter ATP-binding protein